MERIKQMKETLINQVQGQMGDLKCVDTHELGEVIDMIKDLEETLYYGSIVKAMEDKEEAEEVRRPEVNYYSTRYVMPKDDDGYYYRDIDRPYGRMYYAGQGSNGSSSSMGRTSGSQGGATESWSNNGGRDSRAYGEQYYPVDMRDKREGRSPLSRKSYMEAKEMHQDKTVQMKELEHYMQELSQDITEMIQQASPEEKAVLQKKLTALTSKIV